MSSAAAGQKGKGAARKGRPRWPAFACAGSMFLFVLLIFFCDRQPSTGRTHVYTEHSGHESWLSYSGEELTPEGRAEAKFCALAIVACGFGMLYWERDR